MDKITQGGFLVSQVKQLQGRVFDRLLAQAGIDAFNGAQGRILYVLWQEDDVPISVLAQKTGLAKNTLSSMLARMEGSGLITRTADVCDRRQSIVTLTEKARCLRGDYDRISEGMNDLFYGGFTPDEIDAFEQALRKVVRNLKAAEASCDERPSDKGGNGKEDETP